MQIRTEKKLKLIWINFSWNAEKAIELIEDGRLKEHGSKARKFVEKYNWDDIVAEFEGVLEEVV